MDIEIKNASESDANVVAWIVMAALDIYDDVPEKILNVCNDKNTLYSWENTRIVYVDGKIAGGLISYPGAKYQTFRDNTWTRCWDESEEYLDSIPQECSTEEYYLDSMALLPEFRGNGLGRALILDAVEKARELGYTNITLLANKHKDGLVNYYKKIGFEIYGSMIYFEHDYWKMRIQITK